MGFPPPPDLPSHARDPPLQIPPTPARGPSPKSSQLRRPAPSGPRPPARGTRRLPIFPPAPGPAPPRSSARRSGPSPVTPAARQGPPPGPRPPSRGPAPPRSSRPPRDPPPPASSRPPWGPAPSRSSRPGTRPLRILLSLVTGSLLTVLLRDRNSHRAKFLDNRG